MTISKLLLMEHQKNDLASNGGTNVSIRRRSRQEVHVAELGPSPRQESHASPITDPQRRQGKSLSNTLMAFYVFLFLLILLLVPKDSLWVRYLENVAKAPERVAQAPRFELRLYPQDHNNRSEQLIEHEWNVTAGFRSPDGVKKRIFLINDEFPGPTIEARGGDTIRVLVHNSLEDGEEIGLHFHGLHMGGANDMDGAVGFTQCPIRPNSSFLYEFKISKEQHGTFWYHAHDQAQRADGLFGGFIIHSCNESHVPSVAKHLEDYDEEKILLIGDWYHRSADSVLAWYMRAGSFGNEPVPDSIVVNGFGDFDCADAVPSRPVECIPRRSRGTPMIDILSQRKYRFRIVNTGTLAGFSLSMPGMLITPIEVDGGHAIAKTGPVKSVGILYPGERVDVLIELDTSHAYQSHYLQILLDEENFRYPNPSLNTEQRFPIQLSGNSTTASQRQKASHSTDFSLSSATALRAHGEDEFAKTSDLTFVVYATTLKLARLSNVPYGFMNLTSWKPQTIPSLPLLSVPRAQWDENQFVPTITSSAQKPLWVDIVINNLDDGSHPFHLHGYDFFVLSTHSGGETYWGSYNPFDAPEGPPGGPFNLINPIKRDTVFVPRRGYSVIRFRANNEGIWMFHCHILWHQASGMSMGFQVGPRHDSNLAPMNFYNLSNPAQLRATCSG